MNFYLLKFYYLFDCGKTYMQTKMKIHREEKREINPTVECLHFKSSKNS